MNGKTPINQRIVSLKLKRIELCDAILAVTIVKQGSDAEKWGNLREKLKSILAEFDEKNKED